MSTIRNKFILLLLIFIGITGKSFAHGGEDHDKKKEKTGATATYFSSENSSEIYEVLVKYGELVVNKEATLTLYLSDEKNNLPVGDAKLKITNPDDANQLINITAKDKGIYELRTNFSSEKNISLNISIDAIQGADLIQLKGIEIGKKLGKPLEEKPNSEPFFSVKIIVLLFITLLSGLIIGLLLKRKTNSGKQAISIFLIFVLNLLPAEGFRMYAQHDDDPQDVSNANDSDTPQFLIPKETQFLFAITTQKVEHGSFMPSVNLFGTLIPSVAGKAVVQTPQTGIIKTLNVTVGQKVVKGQLLAAIEQNIDASTQLEWRMQKNTLEAEVTASKKEYDRLISIADIAAKRDIDEAERRYTTAVKNLQLFNIGGINNSKNIFLYAPISGMIDNFNFSIGASVNAGQDIFTITNLNKLYVEAQVFDKNVEDVKNGKEYLVECTDDHRTRKVKLLSMAQTVNSTNQSQKVLFEMENTDGNFKIGEFVNIRVFNAANKNNISIPNAAITEVNGKAAVFIKDAAEKYSLSYVSIGEDNGQYTTILKGVEEDEKVVINGSYQLKMIFLNQ